MRYLSIGLPLTLAVGLAAPAVSRAQEPTAARTATCAEAGAAAYDGCALFLEGRLLKRGALGTVVATPGFWRPLPLIAEVGGDSAVRYARSFERNALRGKVTGVAGGLLVVSGLFLTRPARSHGSNDFARLETGAGLTLSGLVLGFVSSSSNRHAASDAARALWWNNSRYSRP
jgi:hypothetical protein